MSRKLRAGVLAAIAILLNPVSHGQEKGFEIRGSVVFGDQPLAHVDVSLLAKGTGDERKTFTDRSGAFSFHALPPGHYDLQVESESGVSPHTFLKVGLKVDRALTLLLPVDINPCRRPGTLHPYFRLLDLGSDKDLAGLSGTVKGKHGDPVEGINVALYNSKLGRIATTRTTREGSFSFARLKIDKNYWIQVSSAGYFVGEFTDLKVLPGYESVYHDLALESCEPGHCESNLREISIMPSCE
jgi:hypothetical protein